MQYRSDSACISTRRKRFIRGSNCRLSYFNTDLKLFKTFVVLFVL
jgi:hypothetical protein